MSFDSISLQNFRSYTESVFTFSPAVNIIVGPNASGKTNLLESVLVASRGGSYRVKDYDLVSYDAPWARLLMRNDTEERIMVIENHEHRSKKHFKLNGHALQRLTLSRTVPVVVFEPNHLQLLSGTPELRRQFMDDILEQTVPGFSMWRRQYRRILSQRNALLKKEERIAADQLFVWNLRLCEFGERIARARYHLIEAMQTRAQAMYQELAGVSADIELTYNMFASPDDYATELLRKIEAHTDADFIRGFTAYGPHREDISVLLNGHAAQETASRGETRTILLVLKVLEAILIEEARGARPLLLFDDVFSELDTRRRQALTKFLRPYQTFITTTDADIITQHFTSSVNIISLSNKP